MSGAWKGKGAFFCWVVRWGSRESRGKSAGGKGKDSKGRGCGKGKEKKRGVELGRGWREREKKRKTGQKKQKQGSNIKRRGFKGGKGLLFLFGEKWPRVRKGKENFGRRKKSEKRLGGKIRINRVLINLDNIYNSFLQRLGSVIGLVARDVQGIISRLLIRFLYMEL